MSDLASLIISITPYAIGALFSPLILVTLLTTISPTNRPRLSSFAYLFGSIIIFLILVFIGLYIGTALFAANARPVQTGGTIEIVLGIILIIIAVKTIFILEESREGRIIGIINTLREDNNLSIFLKFFYYGFITTLSSFTTAILMVIAGVIIGVSSPGFTNSAISVIILGLISLLVVEIPFIFYLISPISAEDILDPFRKWIPKYGEYVASLVYLLLGIFFLVRGFFSF